MDREDKKLHSLFSELVAHDRENVPAFEPLTLVQSRHRPAVRPLAIAIAAAVAIAIGTAVALLPRAPHAVTPVVIVPADDVPSIAEWQSPTASLLDLHDDIADFAPSPASNAATRNF